MIEYLFNNRRSEQNMFMKRQIEYLKKTRNLTDSDIHHIKNNKCVDCNRTLKEIYELRNQIIIMEG